MPYHTRGERRQHHGAQAQDDNSMDIDNNRDTDYTGDGPHSTATTADATTEVPSNNPAAPFSMEILEQALASVVHKFSAGGTLPQLPNEYQDVENLLEMAMSEQASAQDTLVLAIAALRRLHRYVETSWDHAFEGQRESNKFHLTQWEHMRQLYQRIRSIEHKVNNEGTGPSSAADASPGTDSSHTVFNVPNYRYEMLEQKVAQHDEVIQAVRREGHSANPSGDVMDRAVARMKHVSEVQAQDAMREFARTDAARAAQVDGFAEQLDSHEDRLVAIEKQLRNQATKFRLMRTWLVAHQEGDINGEEFTSRVRELDLPDLE